MSTGDRWRKYLNHQHENIIIGIFKGKYLSIFITYYVFLIATLSQGATDTPSDPGMYAPHMPDMLQEVHDIFSL